MLSFRAARLAALSIVVVAISASDALAHCFVGARFLPATLAVDDPCVADELSLPTVSAYSTGDQPSASQVDISGELSKRITPTIGLSIGGTWSEIRASDVPSVYGFHNLETTLKWQFLTLPQQEFVVSAGVGVDWGGTGSPSVGAESFSTIAPTIWFGKGFGDLPDSVEGLRPFAITGQVGYAIPTVSSTLTVDPDTGDIGTNYNPSVLQWGGSLQYSMPYLTSNVVDLGLPALFRRMNPIVEAAFQTPVANTLTSGTQTTGTINPGVIWTGTYFQVGIEAIVPINRESGSNVGVIAQLHIYLDDLFPRTIGRPLFGGSTMSGRRIMGN